MNLDRFLREREPEWSELDQLVEKARGGRPERLGSEGVRRMGALYRAVTADLAWARRGVPGDPVVARLEGLVGRSRLLVYNAEPGRGSVKSFFGTGYWQRVRERPAPLILSALLLFGPAAISFVWGFQDPGAASGVVPGALRSVTEERTGSNDLGLSTGESAAFSSQIFTNNIRVTILSFAAGILLCLGTAFVLLYNGVIFGAIGGMAFGAGNGDRFLALVTPHGVLELSCIVVAAAAGLRMGWAIVAPGTRTRLAALTAEATRSMEIVLGTAPWLVLAGIVEGFVTPSGLGVPAALAVGFGIGSVYWALLWWRGGGNPDEGTEQASVTAGRVLSP